ncbi:MAG: BON domain-containing protein, partial [Planctomycetaceae bacterium]
ISMERHHSGAVVLQRSARDFRLRGDIEQALRRPGGMTLHDLEVRVDDGHVLIAGRAPSYYAKQLAQATIMKMNGVRSLCNKLQVG